MVAMRVFAAAAAMWGLSCAGDIHAGVPLVDGGDEFTTLEPATAAATDRDASLSGELDANRAPSLPPTNTPPGANADAASTPAKPRFGKATTVAAAGAA